MEFYLVISTDLYDNVHCWTLSNEAPAYIDSIYPTFATSIGVSLADIRRNKMTTKPIRELNWEQLEWFLYKQPDEFLIDFLDRKLSADDLREMLILIIRGERPTLGFQTLMGELVLAAQKDLEYEKLLEED